MDAERLIMLEPEDCEAYQLPEGILLIGRCDPFESMGFVDINPKAKLPKKSRPVTGMFKQITGSASIKIYAPNGAETTKTLQVGETIEVPANAEYTIENAGTGKCLVFWKYAGDVTESLEKMKKDLPHLVTKARETSGHQELFKEYQKRMEEKQGNY